VEPIITNAFPKQPREVRWFSISFAELLAAYEDTPRAMNPIEFDTLPTGVGAVTLEEQVFNPTTGVLKILVGGGVDATSYLLTMWIHTTNSQRLEHQVTIKVREVTK